MAKKPSASSIFKKVIPPTKHSKSPPPKKTHSDPIKDVTVFQAGGSPHPALSNPSHTMGSASVYNTSQVSASPNINGVPKPEMRLNMVKHLPKQTVADGNVSSKPIFQGKPSAASNHGSVKSGKQKTSGTESATSTNAMEQWWSGMDEEEKQMVIVGGSVIGIAIVGIIIYSAASH